MIWYLWMSMIDLFSSFGDANRKQALSKVKVKVSPGGLLGHLNAQETEGVPVLLTAKSLTALGASDQFRDGVKRSFVIWNLKLWNSWTEVQRDTCGWICLNKCRWSARIPCRCSVK